MSTTRLCSQQFGRVPYFPHPLQHLLFVDFLMMLKSVSLAWPLNLPLHCHHTSQIISCPVYPKPPPSQKGPPSSPTSEPPATDLQPVCWAFIAHTEGVPATCQPLRSVSALPERQAPPSPFDREEACSARFSDFSQITQLVSEITRTWIQDWQLTSKPLL